MYLQTGGGGKGIRPNQQQQQQHQQHQSHLQSQPQQQQTPHLNLGHHPHTHHHPLQTQHQQLHTIHHNQTLTSTTHFHHTVVQQHHNRQNTPPPTPPLLLGSAAAVHHLTQQPPPPPTQSVRNTQPPPQPGGNHHLHQQFHQTPHFQVTQHLNVPPPAVPTQFYYPALQLSQVGPPPTQSASVSTNNGGATSNSQQYKTSHRTNNRGGENNNNNNNNSGGNMLHSSVHHGRHHQHHHTQQQQQQQQEHQEQINQHGGQSYTNAATLIQTPTTVGNVPSAFMTSPFMPSSFNTQNVMAAVAAQFNNSAAAATATGPPNTTQFLQSVRSTAPPPQQQVQQIQTFVPNSGTSYYTTGTATTHNMNTGMTGQHQICNIMPPPHGGPQHQLAAQTAYMMPNLFAPITQSSRGSLLTSAQQSNASVSASTGGTSSSLIQSSGIGRGITTTHTPYLTPTYCQSPLALAPNASLLGSMPPFSAMGPSPSSSLTSMGSSSYKPIEKKRTHAIPIIDPATNQNILDPKPLVVQQKQLPKKVKKEEEEKEIAQIDKVNNEKAVKEKQSTELLENNEEVPDVEETSDEQNEEGLTSSSEHERDNTNEVEVSSVYNDPSIFETAEDSTSDIVANDTDDQLHSDVNNKMDQQMQTDAVKKQHVIISKTWQCSTRQPMSSDLSLYDEEYTPNTYYATPKIQNTPNAMPISDDDITADHDQDIFDDTKNYGMLCNNFFLIAKN